MADAAGGQPDQRFSLTWLREVELLHLERRPELLEHGCLDLHPVDPSSGAMAGTCSPNHA